MKYALLILALVFAGGATAPVHPVEHDATYRLGFSDGTCSGTAVGPHALLTAEHCIKGGPLIKVTGADDKLVPVKVTGQVLDGSDHAILTVDITFKQWATLGGKLYQQQEVHYWGNPGGLHDIFRRGYVAGQTHGWMLIDSMCFFGDSGAGIFDKSGYVVGVVSTLLVEESFQLTGAKPLAFSRKQLDAAGL